MIIITLVADLTNLNFVIAIKRSPDKPHLTISPLITEVYKKKADNSRHRRATLSHWGIKSMSLQTVLDIASTQQVITEAMQAIVAQCLWTDEVPRQQLNEVQALAKNLALGKVRVVKSA